MPDPAAPTLPSPQPDAASRGISDPAPALVLPARARHALSLSPRPRPGSAPHAHKVSLSPQPRPTRPILLCFRPTSHVRSPPRRRTCAVTQPSAPAPPFQPHSHTRCHSAFGPALARQRLRPTRLPTCCHSALALPRPALGPSEASFVLSLSPRPAPPRPAHTCCLWPWPAPRTCAVTQPGLAPSGRGCTPAPLPPRPRWTPLSSSSSGCWPR